MGVPQPARTVVPPFSNLLNRTPATAEQLAQSLESPRVPGRTSTPFVVGHPPIDMLHDPVMLEHQAEQRRILAGLAPEEAAPPAAKMAPHAQAMAEQVHGVDREIDIRELRKLGFTEQEANAIADEGLYQIKPNLLLQGVAERAAQQRMPSPNLATSPTTAHRTPGGIPQPARAPSPAPSPAIIGTWEAAQQQPAQGGRWARPSSQIGIGHEGRIATNRSGYRTDACPTTATRIDHAGIGAGTDALQAGW